MTGLTHRPPSIALVIPSYNRASAIAETLASLGRQHGGLGALGAIYVADDCSSDGTASVAIRSWSNLAPPLSVVQPPRNLGTYRNVNYALRQVMDAHAWVLFLHDDDIARFDWMARMTERIRQCGPSVGSICSSWDVLYDSSIAETGEDDPLRTVELVGASGASVRTTLMRGCWWHFSGAAVRVQALRSVGLFDESLPQCADWDWILRCQAHGWDVEYIPRALIRYRQHSTSVSSRSFEMHRDLVEHLILTNRYGEVLQRRDVWTIHRRLGSFAGRRAVRAALQARPAGVWRAARTAAGIAKSCARMLMQATDDRAAEAGVTGENRPSTS
jgi:glycosyltransferase involved in cell wall biosynthesis